MQFKAKHILVEHEHEAQDLLRHMKEGKTFEELAMAHSKCPSGREGGALGTFGSGQMVPEFENGLKAIEPGEVSEPVRTQFGYHLILREEV